MSTPESRRAEIASRAPITETAGQLSAAERAMAGATRRKRSLVHQEEAVLTFRGQSFDLTLNVYGRFHRAFPGQSGGPGERRVSPPEPAHCEVDSVTIDNGHIEVEIDAALPEAAVEALAVASMEGGE